MGVLLYYGATFQSVEEVRYSGSSGLVDYFEYHSHCISYQAETSKFLYISASIIQGSGVGPAAYIVTASDLQAITPGNLLCKYADDFYLIVPSSNADTRSAELSKVEAWTRRNNLKLNQTKSVEVILQVASGVNRHYRQLLFQE